MDVRTISRSGHAGLSTGAERGRDVASADVDAAHRSAIQRTRSPSSALPDPRSSKHAIRERSGSFAIHHALNRRASDTQLTLDFLRRFGARLRELKTAVSARLAGAGSKQDVDAKLDRVTAEWQRRNHATGGRLDGALGIGDADSARRSFQLRGLNGQDARRAEAETLTFFAGAVGARPATVYLGPNLSSSEMTQLLSQGLAQLGIACMADLNGDIQFSVPESKWAGMERSLRIKGSGVRFPSGDAQKPARTDVPDVIDPLRWSTDSRDALRTSLQQIVHVLGQVDGAIANARRALEDARQILGRVEPGPVLAGGVPLAKSLVRERGKAAFQPIASLVFAAAGLDANRVRTLLLMR